MILDKAVNRDLCLYYEDNEKKRCPRCGCLRTKKKGFIYSKIVTTRGIRKRKTQRYYCNGCRLSFTVFGINHRKRTSDELKRRAVRDYVLTKNSLQEVAVRYGIAKSSILNWLEDVSLEYPLIEDIRDNSACSGLILVDGKEIKIKKKKKVILIASDATDNSPLYYGIYKKEDKLSSMEFFHKVKESCPDEIKGIISDFGRGKSFVGVVRDEFPDIPHQICLVHFMRYVWLFLPRTKRSKYYWRNQVLKWLIKNIIKAPNRMESQYWLNKLVYLTPFFRAKYHKRFIKSVIRNYDLLTKHYEYKYLVTNTNGIENINRQLERKLKNMDTFKSEKNVNPFLRIWFANFILKNRKLDPVK